MGWFKGYKFPWIHEYPYYLGLFGIFPGIFMWIIHGNEKKPTVSNSGMEQNLWTAVFGGTSINPSFVGVCGNPIPKIGKSIWIIPNKVEHWKTKPPIGNVVPSILGNKILRTKLQHGDTVTGLISFLIAPSRPLEVAECRISPWWDPNVFVSSTSGSYCPAGTPHSSAVINNTPGACLGFDAENGCPSSYKRHLHWRLQRSPAEMPRHTWHLGRAARSWQGFWGSTAEAHPRPAGDPRIAGSSRQGSWHQLGIHQFGWSTPNCCHLGGSTRGSPENAGGSGWTANPRCQSWFRRAPGQTWAIWAGENDVSSMSDLLDRLNRS